MHRLSKTNSAYRLEIDGLRSLAVLSVVLFHSGFSMFSGGFVGVDVFFVISGYLITRLLVAEIDRNGRINFANFYLRRARRLLPAMFFTLICTTVLAFWFLSPQQLESYGASLLHAVLSFSNIYFYSESGYFDTASTLKPLLHTWTLGVEEQFYYVWPLLLGLLAPRKWWMPIFVIIAGFLSLYVCQSILASQTDATFFLMPFRVYEFALGAILVWVKSPNSEDNTSMNVLLTIGLGMVAYSVFNFSEATVFPGVNALIPCVGAALCIYAGNAKHVGRLLRNRLAVGIGLISYSMYLAHWPIIVFYNNHINSGELRTIESLLLVAVSLAAAVFMYFVIEKPFRRVQASNGRFLLTCVLLAFSLTYLGASMWAGGGWEWRTWASSGSLSSESVTRGKDYRFHVRQEICQQKGWKACDDIIDGKVNALIIGDSHAVDALNAFDEIFPEHNFSMSQLGGCPPHNDIESITQPSHPDRLECKQLNLQRFDPEYLKGFDYIVINVLFGWYTPTHLLDYLDFLASNDIKKVVVVGDYLTLKQDMYEILNKHDYNAAAVLQQVVDASDIDRQLKAGTESYGYYFLSKRDVFCPSGRCELFDANRIPFTYDKHHLSYEFASRLAVDSKQALSDFIGVIPESRLEHRTKDKTTILDQFVVTEWGPKSTHSGVVSNKQPNGSMGIWIRASNVIDGAKLEVLFDGQPASVTTVQNGLITAAISSELIMSIGEHEIVVRHLSTGKSVSVGKFSVYSNE